MAEHGHGHESADHHGGHNEWVGPKTKETLGVAGFNMYIGTALLMAGGVAFAPWMIAGLGFMSAGSYAFGARDRGGGKKHH